MLNKYDKREVKEIIDRIFKENSSIVITSEGTTYINGDNGHCINSISWMLFGLYRECNTIYKQIMDDLEILIKEYDKEHKKKESNE